MHADNINDGLLEDLTLHAASHISLICAISYAVI